MKKPTDTHVKVFGVANHEPESVVRALVKAKRAAVREIAIVPAGFYLSDKKSPYKFLLFLTVPDMLRNIESLKTPGYSGVSSLVFANPLKLNEVHGLIPIDYVASTEHVGFSFELKPLDLNKLKTKGSSAVDLFRKRHNYLGRLIKHVQQGSLLNPFMTFIYTLPSSMQNQVKTATLLWLYKGNSNAALDKAFDACEGTVTKRARLKIKEIVFTDVGELFKKAFAQYRENKNADVAKLAKANFVSEYEMNYILSVVESSKKPQYQDSFDKAKNRKAPARSKK